MQHNSHRHYGQLATSQTSLAEAWLLSQDSRIIEDYTVQAALYGWPQFAYTPWWACWFARKVIVDVWPVAEAFIQQDQHALQFYTIHVQICQELGLLGSSVAVNSEYEVTSTGQIIYSKKPRPLARIEAKEPTLEELDLDAIATRIQNQMDEYKKQKSLMQDLSDDD